MNSDYPLLKALQEKDEKAIRYVYWDFFPSVRHYILQHNGSPQDAEDVFQEAILILLTNISKAPFELSSSIKTYHFAICKRVWLHQLSQLKRKQQVTLPELVELSVSDQEDDYLAREQDWNSMQVVMQQITQFCSKLLTDLIIEGKTPLSYKNAHTLHNQKYKCLLQARKAAQKIKSITG